MANSNTDPWNETNTRNDGCFVYQLGGSNGGWIGVHPDGRQIKRCPCCTQRLLTACDARHVLDEVWPLGNSRLGRAFVQAQLRPLPPDPQAA